MLYTLGRWKNRTFSSGKWICRPDFYQETLWGGFSWGTETDCIRQIKYMTFPLVLLQQTKLNNYLKVLMLKRQYKLTLDSNIFWKIYAIWTPIESIWLYSAGLTNCKTRSFGFHNCCISFSCFISKKLETIGLLRWSFSGFRLQIHFSKFCV